MSENKLNIAVIGCSGMAQLHMTGVLAKGVNLYGICDIDGELVKRVAGELNVSVAVTDYRELVNDANVDAVVIVTPDQFHREMTEAFLRAGKAVLCEKPMALNVEDCEAMLKVEKETGGRLMIGQICRCTPAFALAKQLVDAGRIGELFFVESEYAHNYLRSRGVGDWRVRPERDGFIGGGCHAVDLLRWIAGDPTEVYAIASHKCLTDWPANDATVALYKFPNGVGGKVFASIGCKRNYTMRSVFYGTKGTIICDNTSDHIQLFEDTGLTPEGNFSFVEPKILPVDINNHNVTLEIDVFVDALLKGEPMPVPAIEGANTVAVCCATVEAAAKQAPVTIRYPDA